LQEKVKTWVVVPNLSLLGPSPLVLAPHRRLLNLA
jgi:hypothetical protein